uniref:Uncharacterized protein n=1 Tax=Chromera velia CCMP2878 TaxID=1169474 RepID=A0A0G4HQT0_9ALVE|eukprot:Cvel_30332.t1-p1 / transcript=Cvel_30332.t1 / gene=Cvel_30332 / organism=Chromera_velia_CCMP2878 / gene_product=hypothetical protein / transcript_product=hypothetical protein / location=Cvel_scaffold4307:4002-7178(-) / protein_length=132 / sequence_SO=supercontig / SO=protein_coding / is_pseudo=false
MGADDLWLPGSQTPSPEPLFHMRMTPCTKAGGCMDPLPPCLPIALNPPPYLQDLREETNVAPQFQVRFQGPPCNISTDALNQYLYDTNTPIHSFSALLCRTEWRIEGLRFHPMYLMNREEVPQAASRTEFAE